MIYIQIAAYRDPELVPTIQDCLRKAKYPHDLRFGICWQRGEEEHDLDSFRGQRQFTIDEIPWHASQGLCWARARLQGLYEGEQYTLQLDSHHRFAQDWDAQLMEMMEQTGSAKPILTSYAGIYHPGADHIRAPDPYQMVADRFTPSGTILFRPSSMPHWRDLSKPVRARFVSGHYFFTLGEHCQEYRYDPGLYFAGDEISLSIRSFTLGYDLFHPHRTLVWHEYTREGRVKHWTDHNTGNKPLVGMAWHERNTISLRRLRKMLREEDNEEDIAGFGLGDARSHQDYELYAGIDFAGRRLHREAVAGQEPPCTWTDENTWEESFTHHYQMQLKWKVDDLEECDDCQFVYIGIEDPCGNVLYRYDAPADSPEARRLTSERKVEFQAAGKPAKLVVWPVSRSRSWLKRVDYAL